MDQTNCKPSHFSNSLLEFLASRLRIFMVTFCLLVDYLRILRSIPMSTMLVASNSAPNFFQVSNVLLVKRSCLKRLFLNWADKILKSLSGPNIKPN